MEAAVAACTVDEHNLGCPTCVHFSLISSEETCKNRRKTTYVPSPSLNTSPTEGGGKGDALVCTNDAIDEIQLQLSHWGRRRMRGTDGARVGRY